MKNNHPFKIFISAVLLLLSLSSSSCSASEYYSYHNLSYGPEARQKLDLYLPKNGSGEVGLILNIHGGGWTAGDKDVYRETNAYWSGQRGYVSAAINYRYTSDTVDAFDIMDDITSALNLIKEKAATKDITVSKVLLTGGSAGAHLSLLYAYARFDEAPITPALVVSLSGPTDIANDDYFDLTIWGEGLYHLFSCLSGFTFDEASYEQAIPSLQSVSPVTYVSETSIPTIICHGELDDIVPYSDAIILDQALTDHGVKHDFVTFPNSGHGLDNDPTVFEHVNLLIDEYIADYL
ncbi:MAG: alpha/beta hydrolase [Bacilli bacterium]|jgi:acetyl esterase/lipase